MKRILSPFLPAAVLFALTVSLVQAQSKDTILSHSYFDLGYERTFWDLPLDDSNGLFVEGSLGFADHFFILGEYHYSDPSEIFGDGRIDTHDLKIGGGVNFVLANTFDLYCHLGPRYLRVDSLALIDKVDEWAFYVEPGIRIGITDFWELYGSTDYTTTDGFNEWGAEAGSVFKFNDVIGIKVLGRFYEEMKTFGVGVRAQW